LTSEADWSDHLDAALHHWRNDYHSHYQLARLAMRRIRI